MNVVDLKRLACDSIDASADKLISVAKEILKNPETGLREFKTSRIVDREFSNLGIPLEKNIAITGTKATLHGNQSGGPNVAIIGEMDSLKILGHSYSDNATNAAHACGHHCQIAMLLGVATALNDPEILKNLSGRITLMAVPAEEDIEIEFRDELRKEGKPEFLGGKPEFIRLGHFDDIDIAMMTHTNAFPEGGKISYGETSNGMVGKSIKFSGKASYVGRERHIGINALNAAMIALSGIHAQRETYRDQDTIRIQPILTSGGAVGSSVSSSDVRMETYVCGSSIDAFLSASEKVDKALRAGAMAVGGSVTISTLPGSLPIKNDQLLIDIYSANAVSLVGRSDLTRRSHDTESTDMGDVSQLMPVIHPYVNAGTGVLHGDAYLIDDYELGVLTGAKAMAMTTIDLLSEGGVKGVGVVNNYHASLTKQEYLALLRKILKKETYTE